MRMPKIIIRLSLLSAFLMAYVSLMGIMNGATYAKETINWAAQAVGQDYINLFLAFPALVVSSLMLRKDSLKALLVWLGVLLYLIYSYVLYAFFVHFGPLFLLYVAILGLSFYSFVGGLVSLDWKTVGDSFVRVDARPASILLMVVGLMFYALWLADIIGALSRGGLPQDLDKIGLLVNPVQVLDLALLLPGAIIVALQVWQKKILGHVLAVPMMVFFILMGIAIILMMIVMSQSGFPFALPQAAIMCTIILISFIILARHLKGVGR